MNDTIKIAILLLICRYASLYFVAAIEPDDNELIALEVIHRYVELLDRYFGNVRGLFHFLFNINFITSATMMSRAISREKPTIATW